nr:MAG TPA: Replicative helicase [Caudoviricetes sp.]
MEIISTRDIAEKKKTSTQKSQITQKDLMTGTNVETVSFSIFRQQDIFKYMRLSKLTEQDWYKRFENAKVLSFEEKEFKKSFERYCENFEAIKKKGLGIVMIGNPGTGKTFYSNCIMNALNSKYLVYRTSLSTLLEEIRESYKKRNDEDDGFLLERLSKAELVIFDDLGNEFLSDWGKEKMFMILNFLYENDKSMIINSNLDYTQLEEFLKINGSDKLMDRIKSKCKKYLFNWESRRKDLYKKDFEKYF